jgi:cytidylate kinase
MRGKLNLMAVDGGCSGKSLSTTIAKHISNNHVEMYLMYRIVEDVEVRRKMKMQRVVLLFFYQMCVIHVYLREQSATDLAGHVNSDLDLWREFGALQSARYHGRNQVFVTGS